MPALHTFLKVGVISPNGAVKSILFKVIAARREAEADSLHTGYALIGLMLKMENATGDCGFFYSFT